MAKFDLRKWVLKTFYEALGNEPTYKTRRYAEKYHEQEILTDEDMAELDAALDAFNVKPTVDDTVAK